MSSTASTSLILTQVLQFVLLRTQNTIPDDVAALQATLKATTEVLATHLTAVDDEQLARVDVAKAVMTGSASASGAAQIEVVPAEAVTLGLLAASSAQDERLAVSDWRSLSEQLLGELERFELTVEETDVGVLRATDRESGEAHAIWSPQKSYGYEQLFAPDVQPQQRVRKQTAKTAVKQPVPEFQWTETPVLFLSHGAGPCFFMDDMTRFKDVNRFSAAAQFYRDLSSGLALDAAHGVKYIVVVSAHWETVDGVAVNTKNKHSLYYDYYGFPDNTYNLDWPVKGNSKYSGQVVQALQDAGIDVSTESKRGLDHGVFVPGLLVWPDASLPVIEISINSAYDPEFHFALGRALRPLRRQGALIVGSGQTTHNGRGPGQAEASAKFLSWLRTTLHSQFNGAGADELEARRAALADFSAIPAMDMVHRPPDHFVPMVVAAGATSAGDSAVQLTDLMAMDVMSLASFAYVNRDVVV